MHPGSSELCGAVAAVLSTRPLIYFFFVVSALVAAVASAVVTAVCRRLVRCVCRRCASIPPVDTWDQDQSGKAVDERTHKPVTEASRDTWNRGGQGRTGGHETGDSASNSAHAH